MVKGKAGLSHANKSGANMQKRVETHNAAGKAKKKARDVLSVGMHGGEHYRTALLNPFSTAALGVRVPDQFSAPTATLSLREFVSFGNNTSGTADAIFMPNVYNPAFSSRSSINSGGNVFTPDGASYTGVINAPNSLWSKITNYRIASWGLRIRNTTPVTACQGILTVALVSPHARMRVPSNGNIGGQGASGGGAVNFSVTNWLLSMGIPTVGSGTSGRVDVTSLLDFPCHARYQALQLAEKTVEVHPKLTDPNGLVFRDSDDGYWGSDMQTTTSVSYVNPGDASYLMLDGWTSVVVGFSGGSSVANTQTFDVELVYHLEGSPNVSSSTVFIADTPQVSAAPMAAAMAQAALTYAAPFTEVAINAMAAYRKIAT